MGCHFLSVTDLANLMFLEYLRYLRIDIVPQITLIYADSQYSNDARDDSVFYYSCFLIRSN